jgi:anti-anti-sigma factor
MEFESRVEGDTVFIAISGSIDTEASTELTARFSEIAKATNVERAVFDLSRVPSVTSSGIGKLLTFYKHFSKRSGGMRIKGISRPLEEQFNEIHLDLIIPVER